LPELTPLPLMIQEKIFHETLTLRRANITGSP